MSSSRLPVLKSTSGKKGGIFNRLAASATEPDSVPFQYAPLGESQIRVLRISIEPTTGFLIGTFDTIDLESSVGTYRAISYCWGDPTPAYRVLFCNGRSLIVTKSAGEILTHVLPRHPHDAFWIDQLCINQADNVEKSAQVMLMGQIYASAKQVIAWLGCGDIDSEKAIRFVEAMFKEIEDMKRKGLQPLLEPWMSSTPRFRNLITEMSRERKWTALSRLLASSWFERAWVMQEVIMACNLTASRDEDHTIVSFEKCSVSFDALAEVLSVLENDHLLMNLIYDRQNADGTKEIGVDPPGIGAVRLFSAWRNMRNKGTPISLDAALRGAWYHKATDARDKLYAVLGYCEEVADARLRPDYESPAEDVYQAWTTVLLERDDEDAMPLPMAGIGLRRSLTNLPSWVPDFSSASYEVRSRPGHSTGGLYQASGKHTMSAITVDHLSQSIALQGIYLDTVESVFPQPSLKKRGQWLDFLKRSPLIPDRHHYWLRLRWLESIEDFLRASLDPSEVREAQIKEVLWQTMIGLDPSDGAAIDGDLSKASDSWYLAYLELAGKERASLLALLSRKQDFYDQVQTFENSRAVSLQDRPIFGTGQKRLLGHGPKGLLVGDAVYVIKGARTPFLLREVVGDDDVRGEGDERRWRLVGPCFVRGFMYGQGLRLGEWTELVVV
ncbi:MAG: hypothetical protein LQ346_007286 [Caloplaca aetnensis]|nr:MAG: hypothetical protein LQ346_007286 [Caloplaca aetnensis]